MSIYLVIYFTFDLLICSKPKPYPDMADAVHTHVIFTRSKAEAENRLASGSEVWRIGMPPGAWVAKLEKKITTKQEITEVPEPIYIYNGYNYIEGEAR